MMTPNPQDANHLPNKPENGAANKDAEDGREIPAIEKKKFEIEKPKQSSQDAPRCLGMPMKWVSLVMLTFQTTWQVFVIKFADESGKGKYLSSTAILCAEITKAIISLCMEGYFTGSLKNSVLSLVHLCRTRPLEACKYGIPALLYCIQNNMIIYSLKKLSMAVQQVTYQLKILTAAILSVSCLGKHVSQVQWVALVLLVVGVVLVQLPSDLEIKIPDFSTRGFGVNEEDDYEFNVDAFLGAGAVLLACFLSGGAGVYMEMTLKQSDHSLWFKNILMGIFGAISAIVGGLTSDGERIREGGLFQGFTWRVVLNVWTLATGGLMVAVVIKYADNILRQFSTAISILLTSMISALVLQDAVLDLMFFTGATIAIGATFMYNLGLPSWMMRILDGKPAIAPSQAHGK